MTPRKEIVEFAEDMEMKMSKHDEDWGDSWKLCPIRRLREILAGEIFELRRELDAPEANITRIRGESADVANVCMMIAWRAREDWVEKATKHMEAKE